MDMSKRRFIARAWLAAAGSAIPGWMGCGAERGSKPLIVSTHPFGRAANQVALEVIRNGGTALDAVEQEAWVTEADPTNSSVGFGGSPNAEGVVQLDAAIMWGPGSRSGSVAALEDFLHPVSVARRVMEESQHVMLVGQGARRFALEQGFEEVELLTEERRQEWLAWKAEHAPQVPRVGPGNHDTLALLAMDADGNIAAACTTSGWAYKLPGRVGDSPLIGASLYVDNSIGAAGATGLGENILRYCSSFLVVEYMRQGLNPGAACARTIRRIVSQDPKGAGVAVNLVALDKRSRYGAAGTSRPFEYAVTTEEENRVLPAAFVGEEGASGSG